MNFFRDDAPQKKEKAGKRRIYSGKTNHEKEAYLKLDGKKGGLEEISQRTGLSRSTVSKALNNCGSVSSDTKQSVLEAARALDYVPAQRRRVQQHGERWLVAAVLPETPAYFWGEAARGMKAAAERHPDVRLVSSLFSRLSAQEDMLYCLDYAMALQPDLLIVTPPAGETVRRRLAEAAGRVSVACFNETADFPYLFYAGADFAADGAALARAAAETLKSRPRLLRIGCLDMPMTHRRDEGFRQTLAQLAPRATWVGEADISGLSPSVMPAQLAREIHEKFDGGFDAVYVSQGYMPQVLSALDKLGCPKEVAVVGYERIGRDLSAGRPAIVLEQDPCEQGARCVEAALRYLNEGALPEEGRLCVPSRLRRSGEGPMDQIISESCQ